MCLATPKSRNKIQETIINHYHNFHVFDIYRRAGLLRSGVKDKILDTINNCRIAWGEVKSVEENFVLAEYAPLVFLEGDLVFFKKRKSKILDVSSFRADQ